jgi:Inhibitor of growth proteins N-terminal histone-binding
MRHKPRRGRIWRTPCASLVMPRPATMGASSSPPLATAHSLLVLADYAHTLDSLPLDLSRQFADLRELDAVLNASTVSATQKIYELIDLVENPGASKEERLSKLTEIGEEAQRLKLGGEDKIRVASQAADNVRISISAWARCSLLYCAACTPQGAHEHLANDNCTLRHVLHAVPPISPDYVSPSSAAPPPRCDTTGGR